VRVAIVERDPRILPEMGISVRFLEQGEDAATRSEAASRALPSIPEAAVFRAGGRDYVWRIEDGRVERVAVQLGARQGDRVVVAAGLGRTDRLVADADGQALEDGARVDVVEP
jgi:hypothetical protein